MKISPEQHYIRQTGPAYRSRPELASPADNGFVEPSFSDPVILDFSPDALLDIPGFDGEQPRNVLNAQEAEVLEVLFGAGDDSVTRMYGQRRSSRVRPGMLMDIRG